MNPHRRRTDMRVVATLLKVTISLLVILALVLIGLLSSILTSVQPLIHGRVHLEGIHAPVEIIRDRWGVLHIYAQNRDDLFFAQGYGTAQDRLWQMEFNRRVAAGRLSEFGGKATLETDIYLRTLGLYRAAAADAQRLDPESRAILEAYARGVNAYIDTHRTNLPLEFRILASLGGVDIQPEPWTPTDTLAWGKVMALTLSGNMDSELSRTQLVRRLGPEKAAQLEPGYPRDGPFIVSTSDEKAEPPVPPSPSPTTSKGGSTGVELASLSEATLSWLQRQQATVRWMVLSGSLPAPDDAPQVPTIGSNNWVVHGTKTTTGKPLLANDPHLGIQMPSIWHEVHLVAPGWNVAGVTFPGVPGVVIGHNERIAWGVTNVGPDVQDLYIERPNPANLRQFEYQGAWEDAHVVQEEIRVKGQGPVVRDVLITRHGPIVTDVVTGVTEAVALRWTAYEPGTIFRSVLTLNRAQNWAEFRQALAYWDIPSQNVVYADVDGNIGYQMPGRVPIRAKGDGMIPVPGYSGEYEWIGFIPYDELPRAFNPSRGYIVTANNRVIDYAYPYFISNEWAAPYRAQRIVDLLTSRNRLSPDDMAAIQGDTVSLPDLALLRYVVALKPQDVRGQEAIRMVAGWDGRTDRDSVPAAIMETMLVHTVMNTFGDDIGDPLMKNMANYLLPVLERILPDQDNPWWDNITTPSRETRDDILLQSLRETVNDLQSRLGADMSAWRWGRLHTASFSHQALGGLPLISLLFNRGPYAIGGGGAGTTVYAASHSLARPYAVRSISSMRAIFDVADWDNSRLVNTTGQSGVPGSPWYGTMITAWRDVHHHPMPFSRAAVEAYQYSRLVLTP